MWVMWRFLSCWIRIYPTGFKHVFWVQTDDFMFCMFPYEVLWRDRLIELFASTLWIQSHFTSCVCSHIMWSLCSGTIWSGFFPPCCAINVRMFLYCTNMPTWFKLDIAAHRFSKAAEFREQHVWISRFNWAEVAKCVCDTGSLYVGAGSDPEQRACFNHRRSIERRNYDEGD